MNLTEGIDYYIDEQGRYVFTAKYLRERGHCCKNGCRHCPYNDAAEKKSVSEEDECAGETDCGAKERTQNKFGFSL